jgi:hypothetical protein
VAHLEKHLSRILQNLVTVAGILAVAGSLNAKGRHKTEPPPQDRIDVVSHIPIANGSVTRFITTNHYRRAYLYAEVNGGNSVELIDITDVNHPKLLADMSNSNGAANLVSAAGTAALVGTDEKTSTNATRPQTFRIMNYADAGHPVVVREFTNVSAIGRDDSRSLIFLANPEGVWVLQEKLAMDPAYVEEWEHMMLGNH